MHKGEIWPILSFFSGGGFLDMGFEKAGFRIAFSNELDEDFAQFYKEGMSSWSGVKKEISAVVDINELSARDFPEIDKNGPFGIIGGPPCQDFSVRGANKGFDGMRGTLTYHFYERIMDLNPGFFLMENVPGLVLIKKNKKAFSAILDLFREEYFISSTKLNSLHYGVPQSRERLFVFGVKKSIISNPSLDMEGNSWFKWPKPTYPSAEKSYEWGEPVNRKSKLIQSKLLTPPKELCIEGILTDHESAITIPNANEYFKIKNVLKVQKIPEGDTYRPSFKRLHRNKYSPTACYGNNEVHLHPYINRRLSVREALRIQGVPDTYVLSTPGKLTKKFKMIGNGVPVPLANLIALSIRNFLIETQKKSLESNGHLVKEETWPGIVKNAVKRH